MNLLNTPERRVVAANFLLQLGFQSTYFVGIIGCATYVLDAGAAEVSALVFVMNVVMLVGYSAAGALIDAVGPRTVLVASLALPLAAAAVVLAMPVCMASLLVVAIVMGLAGAAASTAVETFPRYLTNDDAQLMRVADGVCARARASRWRQLSSRLRALRWWPRPGACTRARTCRPRPALLPY